MQVTAMCALLHFGRNYCGSFTFANTSSLYSERSASLNPGPTLQSLIEHCACVFKNSFPGVHTWLLVQLKNGLMLTLMLLIQCTYCKSSLSTSLLMQPAES